MASTSKATKKSRTSNEQLRVLVDILSETEGLASGRFQRLHGKLDYKKKWREVAEKLNAVGGASKTVEQWIKVWRDFKRRVSNHVRDLNNQRSRTGNKPISLPPLTELEIRVADLIGESYIQGAATCDDSIPIEEEFQLMVEEDDEIPWSQCDGTIDIARLTPEVTAPISTTPIPTTTTSPPIHTTATPRVTTATPRSTAATPRRGLKRKRTPQDSDDDRKRFLEITEKQAEALRILAENQGKQAEAMMILAEVQAKQAETQRIKAENESKRTEAMTLIGEGLKDLAHAIRHDDYKP